MAKFALSLCLLSFAAFLGVASALQSRQTSDSTNAGPRVSIEKTYKMTPSMQLDATDLLKRAYNLSGSGDRCSIFRQLFAEKYPELTWHVVLYSAYSVQYMKSIKLKVDNDYYLLFGTKK